ncbi:hypothetical protein BD410DRAFT_832967 [Rickenella mellea]|uniref:Uncharacterized protein n=1 Tax=Rickenella mellea TaxID=50990 RepID=A0A4Y7PHX1_9AGAM|nr:hypothetical protein BD410DRAFT_832967 [Rickenella mellea]
MRAIYAPTVNSVCVTHQPRTNVTQPSFHLPPRRRHPPPPTLPPPPPPTTTSRRRRQSERRGRMRGQGPGQDGSDHRSGSNSLALFAGALRRRDRSDRGVISTFFSFKPFCIFFTNHSPPNDNDNDGRTTDERTTTDKRETNERRTNDHEHDHNRRTTTDNESAAAAALRCSLVGYNAAIESIAASWDPAINGEPTTPLTREHVGTRQQPAPPCRSLGRQHPPAPHRSPAGTPARQHPLATSPLARTVTRTHAPNAHSDHAPKATARTARWDTATHDGPLARRV